MEGLLRRRVGSLPCERLDPAGFLEKERGLTVKKQLSTLFAVALAVTTGGSIANVVQAELAARVEGLVGGDATANAKDCITCTPRSKVWGECFHENRPTKEHPKGATACLDDKCIQNYDAWVECNPAATSGTGDCDSHNDPDAPRAAQTARQPKDKLACGTDPGDLVTATGGTGPLPANGKCNSLTEISGKCFIDCSGTLIGVGFSSPGAPVCGK